MAEGWRRGVREIFCNVRDTWVYICMFPGVISSVVNFLFLGRGRGEWEGIGVAKSGTYMICYNNTC